MPDAVRSLVDFVRDQYRTRDPIPLHEPRFVGHERRYVLEAIDSTFVSSVGAFVGRFEGMVERYTGAEAAIATVNGTAALHVALLLAGVGPHDLVITQALTFVATCNAISYCGAEPVFVDVDRQTLGLSPVALRQFLEYHAELSETGCIEKSSRRVLRVCLPMHTFGHPVDIDGLLAVCRQWNLPLIEDAAESFGSLYNGRHTGTFGLLGALSFNGNKIITTGGGGMLLTNDQKISARAKHLTTTARRPHAFEFMHDEVGFNYRLPNINAALGCAQMEVIEEFVAAKRALADNYADHFSGGEYVFVREPAGSRSNYWLNAVICSDRDERDALLQRTNADGVMTRPIWQLMNRLPMYRHCLAGPLDNSEWLEARVVNLPSSTPPRA
jgi:aminotransferase in exopolysaccharide biosynthesis